MCNVRKQFFFVLFGSDLGGVCVCVCVCVCVRACVRAGEGRGGALLSLIGMFTNLSNANIKVSSWLLKGNVDRKSTRLNSSHHSISYAVFCLKKKKKKRGGEKEGKGREGCWGKRGGRRVR